MSRTAIVRGVIVEGYRVASGASPDCPVPGGTIARQIPFFKERGLDLTRVFPGTLNVSIDPNTLTPSAPRYIFRCVQWLQDKGPEDFSLSPCRVTFEAREYDGLIYYPHPETKLAHPHPASIVEVIADFIEGIRYGSLIELAVNPDEFALRESDGE